MACFLYASFFVMVSLALLEAAALSIDPTTDTHIACCKFPHLNRFSIKRMILVLNYFVFFWEPGQSRRSTMAYSGEG